MSARAILAVLLLAVAVNAQQVRHGDAIVIGTPSPGFCGCMPMTAYGEVFDAALGFQRTLWQRPSGLQPTTIAFGRNGDLYLSEFVCMPHGSADIPAMTIRGEWRATTSQSPPRHRATGR